MYSVGVGLLGKPLLLAAVLDATAPAAVLLSRSFDLGSTQLPWRLSISQQLHAREYNTQRQQQHRSSLKKQFRDHAAADNDSYSQDRFRVHDKEDTSSRTSRYSWSRGTASHWQNSNSSDRHPQRQQLGHQREPYKPRNYTQRGAADARPRQDAIKGRTADRQASAQEHPWDSSFHPGVGNPQQQQQLPLPDLPVTLGHHSSRNTSVSAVPDDASISEGHLMALIHRVRSVGDMERLLMRYHLNFKSNHVAAAVSALPRLETDQSYSARARFMRLTSLLASGTITVAHQMDVHQTLACIRALTRPVCIVPLQVPALDRLMSVLLQDDGSKLWKLQTDDLANLAEAAAAIQLAAAQQQQQQMVGSSSGSLGDSNGSAGSLQQQEQQQQRLLGGSAQPADALATSSSSSSTGGALALQNPLQRLWPQLQRVAKPRIEVFSAESLSLLLWGFATAGKANDELLLLTVAAALTRTHKFEDPVTLTRMLQAIACYSNSTGSSQARSKPVLQLLAGLSNLLAQHKAQLSTAQLITCTTALADLQYYSEAVCIAICKIGTRSLKHWTAGQIAAVIRPLVRFRHRDDLLFKTAVKHLPGRVRELSVGAAAELMLGLVQLNYKGTDTTELLQAILGDLYTRPIDEITPSTAAKLLWVTAVMEEGGPAVQQLLLSRVAAASANLRQQQQQWGLSDLDLRLLYQAHRLLTDDWLLPGEQPTQQQQQGDDVDADLAGTQDYVIGSRSDSESDLSDYDDYSDSDEPSVTYVVIGGQQYDHNSESSNGTDANRGMAAGADVYSQQQQRQQAAAAKVVKTVGLSVSDLSSTAAANADWPPVLLEAAQKAAAAAARRSARISLQQQQHVQDLFGEIGLEVPVQGFVIDSGALQPDLAFVPQEQGLNLKIALMCDHDLRYTRNVPFELLGYETVESWLLEKAGWKVVRLTPHEWQLMMQDDRIHEGSDLAYLYNTLAEQGVPL